MKGSKRCCKRGCCEDSVVKACRFFVLADRVLFESKVSRGYYRAYIMCGTKGVPLELGSMESKTRILRSRSQ